jgi:hypothetical protein
MSCEGNRLKFFEHVQAALGLNAQELEKIYQAGKAACTAPGDKETEKTRLLFGDMREVGIAPPTHSADGLPKPASRGGYAAVFDHLRGAARARTLNKLKKEFGGEKQDPDVFASTWPLPILPTSLLDHHDRRNAAGYLDHRYRSSERKNHIWFGDKKDAFGPTKISSAEEADFKKFMQKDAQGFLADGYHESGFDRDGYDSDGLSIYGLRRGSRAAWSELAGKKVGIWVERSRYVYKKKYVVDIEGFGEDGFRPMAQEDSGDLDRFGFNRLGFRQGRSWTGYDENGLDANGKPAPPRNGYDAWGYERKTGLTAPDAQGRRFNLIGWQYDPQTDECFNPQNPAQRMKHRGSWGHSTKLKKVILKKSYVPSAQEMEQRLRDPSIRWQEYLNGSGPLLRYGALACDPEALYTDTQRLIPIIYHSPLARWARSAERARAFPNASFLGALLRCPKCGQFTGAKPHLCPSLGNRKILAMKDGVIIAFEREAYRNTSGHNLDQKDILDEIVEKLRFDSFDIRASDFIQLPPEFISRSISIGEKILAEKHYERDKGETAIALEAPGMLDPEYEGGLYGGFHWKSGLSREGYDPFGFHYLSGRTRSGHDAASLRASMRVKALLQQAEDMLKQKGKMLTAALEAAYSRIATAIAGAGRRVTIAEQGGPRPGMFWTDMRGRIQAERYPLKNTPQNNELNNLLAMKAGIYHELGHEEDTPQAVFARVLEIAKGKEKVEGIPKGATGLVAEIYNIVEDGRMERIQAKRRRGVAATLAADAQINPRWDEKVGEGVPVPHQMMGLMLYRALPFFRVRQEVLDAAPPRVRKLYAEVEPLVDRAMRSPEEAFQSAIEITRKLIEADEELKRFAERMTRDQSQGGKWTPGSGLIISAIPDIASGVKPDATLTIPGRGQGQEKEQNGASQNGQGAGSGGEITHVTPELDEDFFKTVSSSVSMSDCFIDIERDLRVGVNAVLHSPVGKALQKPLAAAGDIVLDMGGKETVVITLEAPGQKHTALAQKLKENSALAQKLKEDSKIEGRRVARRLETLKEEIHKKARLQTSGTLDRKRFKRALSGAETVYRQSRLSDITSLAVSVQLDMSGSMDRYIKDGTLAGTTLALEDALQRLEAEYMVSGFGSSCALIKTFGDRNISDEQAAAMMSSVLGGTDAAAGMRLSLLGLKEAKSANKLHVLMTDGDIFDKEQTIKEAQEMRRNGIAPFGIFFGKDAPASMNEIFGEGSWAKIERLSDLSEVVARRIEQIYRKILATR